MNTERPMRDWVKPQLEATIQGSLAANVPNLELATLCLEELRIRGKARKAEAIFERSGWQPIPWLRSALDVMRGFPRPPEGLYTGHLYVILIDGYSDRNGRYGAYVGVTGRRPETRFAQHRRGVNAARRHRRMLQLMPSLYEPIGLVPGDREGRRMWETMLHETLAAVIPKVTGDTVRTEILDNRRRPQKTSDVDPTRASRSRSRKVTVECTATFLTDCRPLVSGSAAGSTRPCEKCGCDGAEMKACSDQYEQMPDRILVRQTLPEMENHTYGVDDAPDAQQYQ